MNYYLLSLEATSFQYCIIGFQILVVCNCMYWPRNRT